MTRQKKKSLRKRYRVKVLNAIILEKNYLKNCKDSFHISICLSKLELLEELLVFVDAADYKIFFDIRWPARLSMISILDIESLRSIEVY